MMPRASVGLSRPQRAAALVLIGIGLAIQMWLVPHRWINPDEGAHLMDAQLAMHGLIPEVDFGSRQPAYVYAYVPFLALFGQRYAAGRLMPVLATWLAALVLYGLGKRLWNATAGLLAALLYALTPSILINAPVAKTEPLAILVLCGSMYGLVTHLQRGGWWPLFVSGALLGVGYYVRESTLAGVPAALLLIAWMGRREGARRLAQRLIVFALGYVAVCALVIALYARHLPLEQVMLNPGLSPVARVMKVFGVALGSGGQGAPAHQMFGGGHSSDQPWVTTMRNLKNVLRLNLHFFFGAVMAAAFWVMSGRARASRAVLHDAPRTLGFHVGFAWAGCIAALYAYHILTRGFFQFYIREILAPLALLTGAVLAYSVMQIRHALSERETRLRLKDRRVWGAIMAVAGIVGAGAVGIPYGARVLGPAYDCIWSPETVSRVVEVVRAQTGPTDEVLSGAVIWEFEAGRRPFANISHPLGFEGGLREHARAGILERLRTHPPRLIILDGYTEKTYLRHVPDLGRLMAGSYDFVEEVSGSKYPVKIYAWRPAALGP